MPTQAELDLYAGAVQAEALGGPLVQEQNRVDAGRSALDYERDLKNAVHVLVSIPQQINAMGAEISALKSSNPSGATRDAIVDDNKAAQEALAEMLRNEHRLAQLNAGVAVRQGVQSQLQVRLSGYLSRQRQPSPDLTTAPLSASHS